jgi:hypothetical protein
VIHVNTLLLLARFRDSLGAAVVRHQRVFHHCEQVDLLHMARRLPVPCADDSLSYDCQVHAVEVRNAQ